MAWVISYVEEKGYDSLGVCIGSTDTETGLEIGTEQLQQIIIVIIILLLILITIIIIIKVILTARARSTKTTGRYSTKDSTKSH